MKRIIMTFVIIVFICTMPAFGEVITTEKTEGYADYIYIAGDPDNFPIEYYDEELKSYCGVIPDMLKRISDISGMNFVYINGDKKDKHILGENLQVDMVSCVNGNEKIPYQKEFVQLVSYEKAGKVIKCGLAFTKHLSDAKISSIQSAISKISSDERNGIYLSYTSNDAKINYSLFIFFGVVALLFAIIIFVLLTRIKKVKRESETNKMIDTETDMGNLQFFKYHFRYTISDVSRNLYHIAYIILDSSYLRSYYGESSFDDVLKYTASVLSEHTADREISARITENGFAVAFQSTNDEDAQKRLEEVLDKLNEFENVKQKSNKLLFHAAVYHLGNSDKNCELLLFNLRKNCNKIIGTERQIVFCDIHSMNKVQEEKKITESIINGFEKNEFKVYLQFIVDNKSKKIVSAEALSRWDSSDKGLITPGKYIGNMETAGLISKHDFYMFELACRQLEKWSKTEYRDITISCNFTRITLSEENFIDKLTMISNSYSFDKSKLSIEITEDAIEKNREAATQNVRKCKDLGFRVYLDDLGNGYTSLANLCDYPIDVVKIDRDILLKTNTPKGKDLFSGVIALAHSLNIMVICEGVETEEQNLLVSQSDCDYIQGWYYSKPLPLEECETFIKRNRTNK